MAQLGQDIGQSAMECAHKVPINPPQALKKASASPNMQLLKVGWDELPNNSLTIIFPSGHSATLWGSGKTHQCVKLHPHW